MTPPHMAVSSHSEQAVMLRDRSIAHAPRPNADYRRSLRHTTRVKLNRLHRRVGRSTYPAKPAKRDVPPIDVDAKDVVESPRSGGAFFSFDYSYIEISSAGGKA